MIMDVNQEPLAFCTWHCVCKKYKIDDKDVNREPLAFCTRWFIDRACDWK
jgi:hypothetical protein